MVWRNAVVKLLDDVAIKWQFARETFMDISNLARDQSKSNESWDGPAPIRHLDG